MSELRFHHVHGSNIALTPDGRIAQRLLGYGRGLVFSSHPIKINTKVSIKFIKLSNRPSICFGFTSKNPNELSDDLYSYRDLFKASHWIWPLFKNMCIENTVLFYYVSHDGQVHFGIDDEEIDSFYKKVDVNGPLWAVLDVDGDLTTIELIGSAADIEYIDVNEKKIDNDGTLCTVCCQKEIDCVLYKCGHMCMCFECAIQQKQRGGSGQCPICRVTIKDVIRTYK